MPARSQRDDREVNGCSLPNNHLFNILYDAPQVRIGVMKHLRGDPRVTIFHTPKYSMLACYCPTASVGGLA